MYIYFFYFNDSRGCLKSSEFAPKIQKYINFSMEKPNVKPEMSTKLVKFSTPTSRPVINSEVGTRTNSPRTLQGLKDKQDGVSSDRDTGLTGPKKTAKLPLVERKASISQAMRKLRGSVHTLQVLTRLSKCFEYRLIFDVICTLGVK